MSKLSLFWHSVRHIRPSQLAWRLFMDAKRPILERIHRVPQIKSAKWNPPELQHGTRYELLQLHAMQYLQTADDATFVKTIDDWIEHNPPYMKGYWRGAWNCYALSIRTVVWMQQFQQRRLDDAFARRMKESLRVQIQFLRKNLEFDIRGNHLIKNIKALLWAARFFQSETPRAAERLLEKELSEQILPDGTHFELSPAYHAHVLADLIDCDAVLDDGQLRRLLREKIDAMSRALADLTHPDGKVCLFNDGELISGRNDQRTGHIALPHAAYYGMRDGGNYLMIDAGRVGPDYLPAHAHGDIFSFELSLNGQRVIVDSGVFEYHAGPMRDYSRSTRAHNTIEIDGQDQCEFWDSFRMARRGRPHDVVFSPTENGFELSAWHDSYRRLRGKPVHARTFRWQNSSTLLITDILSSSAENRIVSRLHFHPDCRIVQQNADSADVNYPGGSLTVAFGPGGTVTVEDSFYCPRMGLKIGNQAIVWTGRISPPRTEVTMSIRASNG